MQLHATRQLDTNSSRALPMWRWQSLWPVADTLADAAQLEVEQVTICALQVAKPQAEVRFQDADILAVSAKDVRMGREDVGPLQDLHTDAAIAQGRTG